MTRAVACERFRVEQLEPRVMLTADLVGTAFTVVEPMITDGAADVQFTVKNNGDMDAGAFSIQIVHSDDDVFGNGDDMVVKTVPVAGLAAGVSANFNEAIQLSLMTLFMNAVDEDAGGQGVGGISESMDYVGIVIDSGNAIAESNETNNSGVELELDFDDITFFPYDVNKDGAVTPQDTMALANRVGNPAMPPLPGGGSGDIDGDGMITANDLMQTGGRVGTKSNPAANAPKPGPLMGGVVPTLVLQLKGGTTIRGDSQINGYEGWITLDSYSWGLNDGGGLAPQFSPFEFSSSVSIASPLLFDAVVTGDTFEQADLRLIDAASRNVLADWVLSDVTVVSYGMNADSSGLSQRFGLDYATVDLTLNLFDINSGKREGAVRAGWDVFDNVPTSAMSLIASVADTGKTLAAAGVSELAPSFEQPLATAAVTNGNGESYFLRLDEISGSSTFKGFEGWIPLDSFSMGVAVEAFLPRKQARTASFSEVSVSTNVGPHSEDVLKAVLNSRSIEFAEFAVTFDALGFDIMRWQMQHVVPTSLVSSHSGDGGPIAEAITLSPAIVEFEFNEVTVTQGGVQRGKTFAGGFDLLQNEIATVAPTGKPKAVSKTIGVTGLPLMKIGDDKFEEIESYSVAVSNDFQLGQGGGRSTADLQIFTNTDNGGLAGRFERTATGEREDITIVSYTRVGEGGRPAVTWSFPQSRLTHWSVSQESSADLLPAAESLSVSFKQLGLETRARSGDGNDVDGEAKQVKFDLIQQKNESAAMFIAPDFDDLENPPTLRSGQFYLFLPGIEGSITSGPFDGAIPVESYSFSVNQLPLGDGIGGSGDPVDAAFSSMQLILPPNAHYSPDLLASVLGTLDITDTVRLALDARNGNTSLGQTLEWNLRKSNNQPVITGYSVDSSGRETIQIEFDVAHLTQRPLDNNGMLLETTSFAWDQIDNEVFSVTAAPLVPAGQPVVPNPAALFNDQATLLLAIPDAPGESTLNGFEHQIDLDSFSFSVGNTYSAKNPTPNPAVFFLPFSFNLGQSRALPLLLTSLGEGSAHKEVQFSIVSTGSNGTSRLVDWRLEDAHVVGLSFAMDEESENGISSLQLDFDVVATRTHDLTDQGQPQPGRKFGFDRVLGEPADVADDQFEIQVDDTNLPPGNDPGSNTVPGNPAAGLYLTAPALEGGDLIPIKSFSFGASREAFISGQPEAAQFSDVSVTLADIPLDMHYPMRFFELITMPEDLGTVRLVQVIDTPNGKKTPLVVSLSDTQGDDAMVTSYQTGGAAGDRPTASIQLHYDTIRMFHDTPDDGREAVIGGWDVFKNQPLDSVTSFSVEELLVFQGPLPAVSQIRDFDTLALLADPGPDVAELSFVLIDGNGTPGIQLGEVFQVEVHFTDLEPTRPFFDDDNQQVDHPFVNSGFADILFDPDFLLATDITHAADYGNSATGTINNVDGVVDEVGSSLQLNILTSLVDHLVPDIIPDTLLYTITFQAVAPGMTQITADEGENFAPPGASSSEVTLFGLDDDQRLNVNFGSLNIEIEDPSLLTNLVVNAPGDVDDNDFSNGITTLREAIRIANADPNETTITFDINMTGPTITLEGSQLEITTPIVIDAPDRMFGTNPLTISGDNASRVFYISPTGSLTTDSLNIVNGNAGGDMGGGILVDDGGVLDAFRLKFDGNAAQHGGGLAAIGAANVTLEITEFGDSSANTATGNGGGIYADGGSAIAFVTLHSISVFGSTAGGDGGGIYVANAQLVIDTTSAPSASQLFNNTAAGRGGGLASEASAEITLIDAGAYDNNAQFGAGLSIAGVASLNNAQVFGNTATADGGGIHLTGLADLTATQSFVITNTAVNGGGVALEVGTTASFDNSTIGIKESELFGSDQGNTATVNGGGVANAGELTLTGGTIVGDNTAGNRGGGIYSETGSDPFTVLDITNAQIVDNSASGDGGGIYANRATVTVTDSQINHNTAGRGGGIDGGGFVTLTVTNSQINDNMAGDGAGLRSAGAVTLQTNTVIDNNTAASRGGGARIYGGSLTVTDTLITNNRAANGGGIQNSGGDPSTVMLMSGAVLADNTATNDGGGLWNEGGAVITGGEIRGNTANSETSENGGGGIYNSAGGTVTITGATIAGNTSAFHGGGVFNIQGGTVNINAGTVIGGPNMADANKALSGPFGGTGGGIANGGATLESSGGTVNITGATIQGNTSTGGGGGLFNGPAGQMTLTDTTVSGNVGPNNDGGGGIANGRNIGGATLTVIGGRITDNTANSGGGLFNDNESTATLTNVTIDFNNASFGGGIFNDVNGVVNLNGSAVDNNMAVVGGGIFNFQGGPVTVTGGSISNNQAMGNGGGAINAQSTLNLSGVTMRGNSADAGGALHNQSGGMVNITDSTIGGLTPTDGNTATTDGGGILNEATLTITGSTLANNTAGQDGGGIFISNEGTATLTNATVSTNRADRHGGGIAVIEGDVTLNNVTIANNVADVNTADADLGNGGGIDFQTGFVTLNNVAIVNNTLADGFPNGRDANSNANTFDNVGPVHVTQSSGATFAQPGTVTTGDPLLGPLADNGGPTLTHALLEGSPLIDAGVDATGTGVDQRGSTRPSDNGSIANAAGGDGSDIGAFEVLANFADLGLDVTEPTEPVVPGTVVAYTLTPSNAGPVDVNDAVITVNIGSDFTFNQVGSTAGWVDQGQGEFTFALGALVANQPFASPPVFAVMVDPNTTEIATIFVAGIASASTDDPNSENDGVFEVTLIQQPPAVDLAFLNVTGPATVSRGAAFSYVIDTPNNDDGTATATNVVVTATLPAGLTFDSTAQEAAGWTDQGDGSFTFNVGSLAPPLPPLGGPVFAILFPVEVADVLGAPSLTTTFVISDDGASGADTNPADNTRSVTSTVNQPAGTPHVTINDVSANEGNEDSQFFTFIVTLSANPIDTVTLDVLVTDGTATAADGDMAVGGGQLIFMPGESLTQEVNVRVDGDTKFEPNETFNVNLALASGTAVIDDNLGVGTILNDDAERTLLQRLGAGPNGTGSFKFSQTDPFNNLFEFSYKGGGFINLFQEADGRISLDMEDTDPKANLTVKVKGTGDKMLGSLESNTGFSKFSGKGVGFTGDIIVDGRVDSFTAADVADQHIVMFGGSPTDKPAKLTFEQFVDVNFTSGGPVQLTLTDWLDTDPEVNRDSFTAPWVKSITVKGNKKDQNQPGEWSADLVLTGDAAPKDLALGSFKANTLGDGITMEVFGDIKSIDVKDSIDDLEIVAGGAVGSFKFFGGHNVVLDVEEVGSIKSTGSWIGGLIQASSIKSLDIKADKKGVGDLIPGDATGFSVRMFADVANPKSKAAIGKISIDGDATNVNITDEATVPAQAGIGGITIKGTSDFLNIVARAALKSLKLADVQEGNLNAGSVGTIQATRWLSGAVTAVDVKSLKTTGDKKANVTGDYMPETTINVAGQSQAKSALGSASIAGVLGGFWTVVGPTGAITAGSVAGWDTAFVGDLKSLTSKSSFTDSFLAAVNIGKFDVKLQVADSDIVAGGPDGTTGPHAVGSFKVGSAFMNSTLKVGVDPVDGFYDNGDDIFLPGDENAINSLTIGGAAIGDGIFIAGFVKSPVKINNVAVDPTVDSRFIIN